MLKTMIAALAAVSLLSGGVYAQSKPKKDPATRAKNDACKAEAKAKKLTGKEAKDAFMKECKARS